jgi:hypothetical protein
VSIQMRLNTPCSRRLGATSGGQVGQSVEASGLGGQSVQGDDARRQQTADRAVPVLAKHRVPQAAAAALPDADQLLLVDPRQRLGVERLGAIGHVETDAGPGPRARPATGPAGETTKDPVESLADDLFAEVAGRAHGPVELLSRDELAVLVVMAAVHAPQPNVVG